MDNKKSFNLEGLAFGTMDGIVGILAILTGLGTVGSKIATIVGVLAAGLANSFGNAAGVHVSQESEGIHTPKEIRRLTLASFFATLFVTVILICPLLLFQFNIALVFSWILGLLILALLGYSVSVKNGKFDGKIVLEYVLIGIFVSVVAFFLGEFAKLFIDF